MRPLTYLPALLAASLLSSFATKCVAADLELSLFGGAQCDAPAVRDDESFDSTCSFDPLVGAGVSFPGPGLGDWRVGAQGQYARRAFGSEAFATDTDVRTDFLELALTTQWPVYESSRGFRLVAVVGPEVGILVRARRSFQGSDYDITDELRSSDLRIVAALRLTYRRFFVDGGLAWGLTDLDNTNQQQIHSRAVVVKLGIIF